MNYILRSGYTDGIQVAYDGIRIDATRKARINNVRIHHFGYDGIWVNDVWCPGNPPFWPSPLMDLIVNNSTIEYNGRNNISWTGGKGVTINNSQLCHAGYPRVLSDPAAGIDIEYEGGYPILKGTFRKCFFGFNAWYGVSQLADHPFVRDLAFYQCLFVSSFLDPAEYILHPRHSLAAQTNSKRIAYNHCSFVGEVDPQHDEPVNTPADTATNYDQTKFLFCEFYEQFSVPEFRSTTDNGIRSFAPTIDELGVGCPVPDHFFQLNLQGARQEMYLCISHTNYTVKNAYIRSGNSTFNRVKMTDGKFYNHGLNACGCNVVFTSIFNTNFIGGGNGAIVTNQFVLRNSPGTCPLGYLGYYDQTSCSGNFIQNFPNPDPNSLWDTVPKYLHPIASNRVTDLFIPFPPCTLRTTTGIQSGCLPILIPKMRKVTENLFQDNISIRPNPATEFINISNLQSDDFIIISNLLGENVLFKKVNGAIEIKIDITNLFPGIYFIKTKKGYNKKFVKL